MNCNDCKHVGPLKAKSAACGAGERPVCITAGHCLEYQHNGPIVQLRMKLKAGSRREGAK